jgi:putative methyltransferase (TIGR04325 family)
MKNAIYQLCPPLIWNFLKRHFSPPIPVPPAPEVRLYGNIGNFATFEEVAMECGPGYRNPAILERTAKNTAAIQRQTMISQLNIRLLAALQYVGAMHICDFGGALGAHYFHLRHLLNIERWTVVELEETVRLGTERFADGVLDFSTIMEPAPVILSSGSLQYTPDPHAQLQALIDMNPDFLVLDKVPILSEQRITMQRVHPSLFGEEILLPCMFFSEEKLRAQLSSMRLVMEWGLPDYQPFLDGVQHDAFHGFVLRRDARMGRRHRAS